MKKLALGGITLGLIFTPLAALACGSHGTNAGQDLASWLANNTSSSGNVSISAWGSQTVDDNITDNNGNSEDVDVGSQASTQGTEDEDEDGNWGNANYWVSIELPDGSEVTINTTAQDWDRDEGGGAIEAWLYEEGLSVIESWFNTWDPEDKPNDTFTG